MDRALDQSQGLLSFLQLEQSLGQQQRNLRIILVIDQAALECLDRQLVALGGQEDQAEVQVGRGRIVAQNALLIAWRRAGWTICRPAPRRPWRMRRPPSRVD